MSTIVALLLLAPLAVAGEGQGTLKVVIVDGWADVQVDGRWLGLAPVEVDLPAGTHEVRTAESTYHEASSTTVQVEAGRTRTVYVRPPSRASEVRFDGYPAQARVRVNGLDLGTVAGLDAVRIVADGTYDIDLVLAGRTVTSFRVLRCPADGCLMPGGAVTYRLQPQPGPR